MISVLFVCMGNICRSPTLGAVLQDLVHKQGRDEEFLVDSCALTSLYLGCQADERTRQAALKHGLVIDHFAKLFQEEYFQDFDYIFAVDNEVLKLLNSLTPLKKHAKILLATAYSKRFKDMEIRDPYYQEEPSFDHVLQIAEDSCKGFLMHIDETD